MERMDELRRPEANTRLLYSVVCAVSGSVIVATLAYAVATATVAGGGLSQAGKAMVEAGFPLPSFAQPVAYLGVASVAFFYSGLRLWQSRVARLSQAKLASIQLLGIVVAFASAYEVVYNFMLWGSYASVQALYGELAPGSTLLAGPAPIPWGPVLATWVFAALLVISGYTAYFLRKIHQVRIGSDVF